MDAVLGAIRQSRQLLGRSQPAWETIAWVRSMADATNLAQTLRDAVFREVERAEGPTLASVGVVRRDLRGNPPEIRWGVLVRLSRP